MAPTLAYEREFQARGFIRIAGCDEAGRGCWAGPVVAGAVVLPSRDGPICSVLRAAGLRDSKRLTPAQREELVPLIEGVALAWAVGKADPGEIDEHGIAPATRLAMQRALDRLQCAPDALLLDAFPLPEVNLPQDAIVKGDDHSLTIAAASVLAKVYRDAMMVDWHAEYPGYGFAQHKGYGTPQHRDALNELGPTPLHRHTWAPILRLRQQEMELS